MDKKVKNKAWEAFVKTKEQIAKKAKKLNDSECSEFHDLLKAFLNRVI
jgi:hypothetical protein